MIIFTIFNVDRVIREKGITVENGVHEIHVNLAVNDGTDIAELMQFFKKSSGTNKKFEILCGRVDYFKQEKEGVKIMATLFEQYVAEERAESLKRGIKSTVKAYFKCKYSPEAAKEAVLEEYSDVSESIIDDIIDEVYGLVR